MSAMTKTRKRKGRGRTAQRMFQGRSYTPPYDPPMYLQAPWWNLTVNFEDPFQSGVAYSLTPGNVRGRVLSNLGITANAAPNFVFKIKKIAIWSVASASSASVALSARISSLVPTVSDDLNPTAPRSVYYGIQASLDDSGTLNKPAAVGWVYSMQDQCQIISPDQTFTLANYSAGGDGYIRILIDISFSFAGVAAPL